MHQHDTEHTAQFQTIGREHAPAWHGAHSSPRTFGREACIGMSRSTQLIWFVSRVTNPSSLTFLLFLGVINFHKTESSIGSCIVLSGTLKQTVSDMDQQSFSRSIDLSCHWKLVRHKEEKTEICNTLESAILILSFEWPSISASPVSSTLLS